MKLLEKNIGVILQKIVMCKDFLEIPNALGSKSKIDKWNYIRLKSFCTATECRDNLGAVAHASTWKAEAELL